MKVMFFRPIWLLRKKKACYVCYFLLRCKCFFFLLKVSFELRRLADRKLPNVEDVTKLAMSVEEFTNCLIDPLKSDSSLHSKFQSWFDEVMETGIEFEQKKVSAYPRVVNSL